MAYDIGPKIGIDGETKFRNDLQKVNASVKALGAEMKMVTTAFLGQEESVDSLTAQNSVLAKSIDKVKEQIDKQREGLELATKKYGADSEAAYKWQRAINESTAELNKLEAQLRDNERRMEDFGKETEKSSDSLDDASGAFDDAAAAGLNFGDVLKANVIGGAIVEGIKAIGSAALELASELINLDEATAEYRAEQGKLVTAFEANGHGADVAAKAYTSLYKVVGDSGEATEAAQLLANLAKSTQDVDAWARIAAGTAGQFGDALPITSLIEAANEAAKTGESVSALDDALNWVGEDTEAFKASLAAATTEEERLKLITDTLSKAYDGAADSFYEANAELIRARENEKMLQDASAALGGAVSTLKNNLISEFAPSILAVSDAFADMILGVDGADEEFAAAVSGLLDTGVKKLPEFIGLGVDMIFSLAEGILSDPEKLADTVLSVVGTLGEKFIEHAPDLIVSGAKLIAELLVGIVGGIDDVIIAVPGMIRDIVDAFWEHRGEFVDIGKRFAEAIKEGLGNIGDWITGGGTITGWGPGPVYTPKPMPHATGLNYVPYDGYLAELHKGEMVLTARQAEMMRSTGVTQGSVQSVAAAMVNGIQSIAAPSYDQPAVINLVTPEGDVLAAWQLPSLIRVANASGTPIVNPM